MATLLPLTARVPPCLSWVVGRGGRAACERRKCPQNASRPAKHNAPKQRITNGGSPGCTWRGGGGRQLPTAGRTEGQSGASARSRSYKAVSAHPAHVQQITRADSNPGSFTALIFSLERTLPEQSLQRIKHQYGFCQHHVCVHTARSFLSTDIPRGQRVRADPGLGSPWLWGPQHHQNQIPSWLLHGVGKAAVGVLGMMPSKKCRSPHAARLPLSSQLPGWFWRAGRGTEPAQRAGCSPHHTQACHQSHRSLRYLLTSI